MPIKLTSPVHALELGDPIIGIGKYQNITESSVSSGGAFEQFISTLIAVLTAVAGIAFLIYFILGALSWITAGGQQDRVEKAKKQMTDAFIGLVAVTAAYFIASIIGTVLDINILNPAAIINSSP